MSKLPVIFALPVYGNVPGAYNAYDAVPYNEPDNDPLMVNEFSHFPSDVLYTNG